MILPIPELLRNTIGTRAGASFHQINPLKSIHGKYWKSGDGAMPHKGVVEMFPS